MFEEPLNKNEPWQTISDTRDYEVLHREISKLPHQYREVIVLYHLEGKSRSKIADILDCTTPSVKALLARARKKLRRRLIQQGIAGSIVLLGSTGFTSKVSAAPVSELLVQSTLAHCCGAQPYSGIGNGPEFVKSLLTKEPVMSFGILQNCLIVVACVGLVSAMAAASLGMNKENQSGNEADPANTSISLPTIQDELPNEAYGLTTFTVASPYQEEQEKQDEQEEQEESDDSSINEKIQELRENLPDSDLPTEEELERLIDESSSGATYEKVPDFDLHSLKLRKLKTDGAKIYFEIPSDQEVMTQKYRVEVPEIGADGEPVIGADGKIVTILEERTRLVRMRKTTNTKSDTNKKTKIEIEQDVEFESLDDTSLTRKDLIDRIGMTEITVLVVSPTAEIPNDLKKLLKSDTIVMRSPK